MPEKLKITYVGHATLLIEIGAYNILTDPHFGKRFMSLKRIQEPGIPFHSLPKIDFVLISHAHHDHLHKKTLRRFAASTTIIAPKSSAELFLSGVSCRVVELSEGEILEHENLKITAGHSRHKKAARIYFGPPRETFSYVISAGGRNVFFAGDSAYGPHFKEIGKDNRMDVALLPIGPHKPRGRMKSKHMDPANALQAFEDLGADFMVPYHWGTFHQMAFARPKETRDELLGLMWERNLWDKVILLKHGESKEF